VNEPWLIQSPNALSRTVGSETFVTAPGTNDVVRLAGTAGAVWSLLDTPQTVTSLVEALGRVYREAPEAITADVERLVSELRSQGWVEAVADGDD
jgi:Coenzyme PQQ synthesis protein D (PqqD)